jgi:hypothetical protein
MPCEAGCMPNSYIIIATRSFVLFMLYARAAPPVPALGPAIGLPDYACRASASAFSSPVPTLRSGRSRRGRRQRAARALPAPFPYAGAEQQRLCPCPRTGHQGGSRFRRARPAGPDPMLIEGGDGSVWLFISKHYIGVSGSAQGPGGIHWRATRRHAFCRSPTAARAWARSGRASTATSACRACANTQHKSAPGAISMTSQAAERA